MAKEIYIGMPSEYQEVEYLESTGTQYIDTGYFPNGNMKYELEIKNSSATGVLFGAYNTTWTDGNGFYTNIANTSNQYDYKHYASNTKIAERTSSADMTLVMDRGKIFIDGVQYHDSETVSFNVTKSLYIYAGNMNGSVEQPTKYQLYYFKMYDNDILVRDYIPCYRKSDNIPGLYDLVNNRFYINAGTGTFLIGNNKDNIIKSPSAAKKVKNLYIGVNNIAHKIKKIYVGIDNIAKLAYEDELKFTSCLFPTKWTEVTWATKYKATNDYGEWVITADSHYDTSSDGTYRAFDNDVSTSWNSLLATTSNSPTYVQIDCPIDIKPAHIYIKYLGVINATIIGYNSKTNAWETICSLPDSASSKTSGIVTIDTDVNIKNYYSSFKFNATKYEYLEGSSVYEFKITSGSYKPII